MKAKMYISLWWGDEYSRPPKSLENLDHDKRRVKEILERMGYGEKFESERKLYEFELDIGSEALNTLIAELQSDPHLAGSNTTVWRSYARQELESADLLIWGPTNQAIEDDYYDFDYYDPSEAIHERDTTGIGPSFQECPACYTSLKQRRDLVVNKRLMRGKDISLTYAYQVILSEWVGHLLQEHGLSGFELRPVQHYRKPYSGESTLYQLVVTNTLAPMAAPPTEFEGLHHCDACGRTSRFLKHTHWWGEIRYRENTNGYYPRQVLRTAKDFNHTAEYFGELRVAYPYVIITQRVYRLLREHKVKNWAAVPVLLAD